MGVVLEDKKLPELNLAATSTSVGLAGVVVANKVGVDFLGAITFLRQLNFLQSLKSDYQKLIVNHKRT